MAVDLYSSEVLEMRLVCLGDDGCIGAPEAAILAGVTRQRICQAIWAGKLKAEYCARSRGSPLKTRGIWRIRLEDLWAWRREALLRE